MVLPIQLGNSLRTAWVGVETDLGSKMSESWAGVETVFEHKMSGSRANLWYGGFWSFAYRLVWFLMSSQKAN